MPVPLEIVARQVTLSAAARALIARLTAKLTTFDDRLLACRVVVEVPQRFPAGRPVEYRVAIRLAIPGRDLVIHRQCHPVLETAVQNAFVAAGRRLQDAVHRRRGDVKRRPAPAGSHG